MSTLKSKAPKPKETKYFWVYFVVAAVGLVAGIFLLPVWSNASVFWKSWSKDSLSIILCVIIVLYILLYLINALKREQIKALKIMTAAELVVLALIAVGCLLQQFNVFDFFGPCFVFGAIFWLRGCLYIVKAYLFDHKNKGEHPLWLVIASVLMVSFGAVFMAKPIPGNEFIWIVSVFILFISLCCVMLGVLTVPKKTTEKTENEID